MSFLFHDLQDIFFPRLEKFLLFEDFDEESLNSLDLSDLKINNWKILFPSGLSQMMLNFDKWQSRKSLEIVKSNNQDIKSQSKQMFMLLNTKITKLLPKSTFLKQQAFFAHYKNHLVALDAALYFCNLVWRCIGDKSTDFSFYSKRASLLLVYSTSVVFYSGDDTESYIETENFIKNMFDSFSSFHILKKKLRAKINIQDIPILRYIFQ